MSIYELAYIKLIEEAVYDHPDGVTVQDVAKLLNLKPSLVEKVLLDLEKNGRVYTSRSNGRSCRYYPIHVEGV
jgi:DNA-binding MarR family transcriptional regulator